MKTILEPTKRIPLVAEADVIILGGGPAGISAAIGSAGAGATTILIERYGWLGGQTTGGYVVWFIGISDGKGIIVKGFCEDVLERLRKFGALEDKMGFPTVHPEYLKHVFAQCAIESDVVLYLHHWAVDAIMSSDENRINSVIVESKSGREAISGRIFIDATGDGDMAKWCGIPFSVMEKGIDPFPIRWGLNEPIQKFQLYPVSLCYRIGNVDVETARRFQQEQANSFKVLCDLAEQNYLFRPHWGESLIPDEVIAEDICLSVNPCDAVDLSWAEVNGRRRIMWALDFYRENFPGFENAHLIGVASQIGVRESRQIFGRQRLDSEIVSGNKVYSESIALAPIRITSTKKSGNFCIPYGCLVPQRVENLLFAGRCISADHEVIDFIRLIATCMATGQAAGIAAALALDYGNNVSRVKTNRLHEELTKQNCLF